jgi:hypothetical protein
MNRNMLLLVGWWFLYFIRSFVAFPFVPRMVSTVLFWTIVINLVWIPKAILARASGWKVRIGTVLLLGLQLLLGVAVDMHFHSFMEGIH